MEQHYSKYYVPEQNIAIYIYIYIINIWTMVQ